MKLKQEPITELGVHGVSLVQSHAVDYIGPFIGKLGVIWFWWPEI